MVGKDQYVVEVDISSFEFLWTCELPAAYIYGLKQQALELISK